MAAAFWFLQNVDLFRSLSEAEAEAWAARGSERTAAADQPIAPGGEAPIEAAIVWNGELMVVGRGEEEGAELQLGILGPGDVFGETILPDDADEPNVAISLEPLRASTLVVYAATDLAELAHGRDDLGPETRAWRRWRVEHRVEPLAGLLGRGSLARVTGVLLALASPAGVVRARRLDLARLSGLGREACDAALERLEQRRLVTASLLGFRLVDRVELERLAAERVPASLSS